jgi:hypothetical protein
MTEYNAAFSALDSQTIKNLQSQNNLNDTVDSLKQKINDAETANLFQSFNNAEQSTNNTLTYGMMLNRNQTIRSIATDMTTENKRVNNGARDTFSRQSEINEWSAQNKLDTLFFLQTTFIYFCILVISFYFRQYGLFPNAVLYIIAGLGLLILIGILWNRASYTSISRDKRYWNRRYLGLDDSALESKLVCSLGTS